MERGKDTSMRQVNSPHRISVSPGKWKCFGPQKAGFDLRPKKEELIESLYEEQQP